jgi:hypothetical protein
MRSRAAHCLGRLAGATIVAWLVGACTVVVPLVGVSDVDGSADPMPDRSNPSSEPPPVSPADALPPPPDVAPASDGDEAPPACFDQPVPLKLAPPQAIIAFDRSARVTDTRVEAIRVQLAASLALIDKAVQFGYLEFPNRACDGLLGACCESTDVLVPPARGTGAAINQQLLCNANGRTCGSVGPRRTPTDAALNRIGDYYRLHPTLGGPEQFAVVITDSEPDCGGQDGACRQAQFATEMLFSNGVKTAILGLGQDASPQFNTCLPQLADAGGNLFGSSNGQGADYPWAPDADAMRLRQAMDQLMMPIRNRACVIKLAAARDRDSDVTVSVNGAPIKFDRTHVDGWDFDTSRKVRIWGPRCDDIQAGRIAPQEVEALVTCRVCGGNLECR